jgi:hypothetical protein
MQAHVRETEVHVIVTLTQDEAKWLRGAMQNPIYAQGAMSATESLIDKQYREHLFKILPNFDVLKVAPTPYEQDVKDTDENPIF